MCFFENTTFVSLLQLDFIQLLNLQIHNYTQAKVEEGGRLTENGKQILTKFGKGLEEKNSKK